MEWKEVTLGEIAIFKTGKLNSNAAISNGEYPFFTCSPETLRINSYAFDQEAILLAGNNAEGNFSIKYYKGKFNAYQRTYVITPKRGKVDIKFLYYALSLCLKQLKNMSQGTSTKFLTVTILNSFSVQLPSFSDQRRIASILSSLDRKIELNNKINADLEEMAQAIFKNWFVDFEPFKDGKFVNSELGMIPEGWKVVAFDNILKVTTMKTGKEGIPEYSVTNTGIHPRDEKFTKNLSKSSAKNKLIRKGNLVFGMSREILNWGIMKEEVGGVSSAYNVYLVDENIVNTIYLECFIAQRMDYFADLIKPASREGQGVDKALLLKKIICIPPSEIMDVFLEKYDSIMHLAEIRKQESSHLSLLRDTLLPRLMSGEIEVPE